MDISRVRYAFSALSFLTLIVLTACGAPQDVEGDSGLTGTVAVDGSSTVFPITEAVAEEFGAIHPRVRATVGISGTGGGFKKFTVGETDINDASRPIKPTELEAAAANGIDFIELPVAFDGLSVVVNPANHFVDYLTVEELRKIWQPGSTVTTWQDVRSEWPAEEIALYGPGTDSGTFDYFTETINGVAQSCRSDFTASEDDNVLVQGVAGDVDALGFFGYAYFAENQDQLKVVPIDGGSGPVAPTLGTIGSGTYSPLSRPIFIYVSTAAASRPEVESFVQFYLDNATALTQEVGYVPLPQSFYDALSERFAAGTTGTAFAEPGHEGETFEELYSRPST